MQGLPLRFRDIGPPAGSVAVPPALRDANTPRLGPNCEEKRDMAQVWCAFLLSLFLVHAK